MVTAAPAPSTQRDPRDPRKRRDPRVKVEEHVKEPTPEPEINVKSYTDLLVSAPSMSAESVQSSVSSAFSRILNSQIVFENSPMRRVWMQLLSKMAGNQILKYMLLDFCTQEFQERYDLVIIWLHEEWKTSVQEYRVILDEIMIRVLQSEVDRILGKFLLGIPEIYPTTIDLIADMCEDPERANLGLSVLRDIILHRPAVRMQAFEILLDFTRNPGSDYSGD